MESGSHRAAQLPRQPPERRASHVPWGLLAAIEVVVLALLSLVLVLGEIPTAFDVDWGCLGISGVERTSGDTYVAAFAVFGALSWIAAAAATTIAYSTGRRRLAFAIPAALFVGLTLTALVVAAVIGPLPC